MAGRPKQSTRQYEVLKAIKEHRARYGFSPTLRELMNITGISSTSVIAYYIRTLEREGLVVRVPNIARSIELTDQAAHFDRDDYKRLHETGKVNDVVSTRPHLIYRAWRMQRDYLFYYRIRKRHVRLEAV